MRALLKRLGWAGAALIALNEVRGLAVVAALLAAWKVSHE